METLDLLQTATKLVKLMGLLDQQADKILPQEIVSIVKLHSKLAVGAAWIPVPGADIAAGAAAIWGMYIRINGKIKLKVKDNVIKTIASGIGTNLLSYVAMSGVASSLKFIPGLGTLGGALIMSASQYAITLTAGWIYLKALCVLAEKNGPELDISKLNSAVKDVLSQKDLIKNIFEQAKKEGKKLR